tara:strand:- start:6011 stop:7738 length:1728 start_codon:yes stop_codon:yes gene_type:complete
MADPSDGVAASENDRVPCESIKVIAQTVGIESLSDEVARALAPDVEYRLREVIQDAMKFAKHSKRGAITTEDVNASLKLRDVDPLYGFPAGAGPVAFREVPGQPELFFTEQKELQLKDVLAAKLPRPPVATNVVPHWLAVDGVQPVIPENPNPLGTKKRGAVAASDGDQLNAGVAKLFRAPVAPDEVVPLASNSKDGDTSNIVVEPTLAHELSKELQLYFDRVTSTIRGGGSTSTEAPILRAALESLETDNGLHQLVPYFVTFVQTEVSNGLKKIQRLKAVLASVKAIVQNKNLNVELYLHQLMPSVMTCMVAKKIGGLGEDAGSSVASADHWSLREQAAETISLVCRLFGERYPTIQPRITRTLLKALLDDTKPLATHFGAICGLSALGPRVTRLLILPHLKQYLAQLEPKMTQDKKKPADAKEAEKASRRVRDATKVHDALKRAVGECLHAALTVPASRSIAQDEPGKRAKRLQGKTNDDMDVEPAKKGKGKAASKTKKTSKDSSVGWKIGKSPGTLKVDVGGREESIPIGDDAVMTSEDPAMVAKALAAAAALLGDCVVPYAAVPEAGMAFL